MDWNMDHGTQWYPCAPGSRASDILEAQQNANCGHNHCCCDMDKLCELVERAECAAREACMAARKAEAAAERAECKADRAEEAAQRAECKADCADAAAQRAECAAKESCRCADRQSWPRNCRCGD